MSSTYFCTPIIIIRGLTKGRFGCGAVKHTKVTKTTTAHISGALHKKRSNKIALKEKEATPTSIFFFQAVKDIKDPALLSDLLFLKSIINRIKQTN